MSPMHPKLRQALLRDPEHRRRGLTAQKLLEYERLLTQLFFATHYAPQKGQQPARPGPPDDLLEEIRKFRQDWLPNFDAIHARWVQGQKRALEFRALAFRPSGQALKSIFGLLSLWLKSHFKRQAREKERR
ncbi:MAG: hypothetical protein Q9P14_00080 [candidate division KSB1 bacterium]|nr:hypothetical protein [candidate division KSB1 bacterium]MDQ7062839.1 hypothetical protein [candidate division KSB1 bacterium]